ncbi:MAG: proton-conducting transporter membrane subunit [Gammaproteobacteria bacterium]|nr:proton-conducting transporter membrane subunit [Gammaproteobacteria bacterium]
MSVAWTLLSILSPLLLSALPTRRFAAWVMVLAALPALLLAIAYPVEQVHLEWLMLGVRLGLDDTGRGFLGASALVWLLSGAYAASQPGMPSDGSRFRLFFLLAMSGNFTLILAQDMLTFYLGFTLMGLSAYGLVAHHRGEAAQRAGRSYLIWTLCGELLLFSALLLLVAQTGETDFASLRGLDSPPLAAGLLILGFGIKLALPGLHFWLPASYAAAPAAAAAVLSGPMISTGLLGWLRFLPPGQTTSLPWQEGLILIGLLGLVLGVGLGLLQHEPKRVLAYSSIGKMGLLVSGYGVLLADPASAPWLTPALVLFTLHHLLVKSALFLGLDLHARGRAQGWVWFGLGLLGLALIGAPFTSGALAKAGILAALPSHSEWFGLWLSMASTGTTLLMGRLAYLLRKRQGTPISSGWQAWMAWALGVVSVLAFPYLLATPFSDLSGGLPLLLGVLLSWLMWRYRPQGWTWPARVFALRIPGHSLDDRWFALKRLAQGYAGSTQIRDWFYASWHHSVQLLKPTASPHKGETWSRTGPLWLSLIGLLWLAMVLGH